MILVNPRFQGPRWRTFRVCTFVGTGLSGFAPLIHGISVFGFAKMMVQSGMPYYLGEGGLLILGALFYTVSTLTQKQDNILMIDLDAHSGINQAREV